MRITVRKTRAAVALATVLMLEAALAASQPLTLVTNCHGSGEMNVHEH